MVACFALSIQFYLAGLRLPLTYRFGDHRPALFCRRQWSQFEFAADRNRPDRSIAPAYLV